MSKESSQNNPSLNIVGIGASAGGLTALKAFFEHCPARPGVAFVVVIHLPPKQDSKLAQILQRSTKMNILQVTDPVKLEKNHVYVIPPDFYLNSVDGHLRLSHGEEGGRPVAPIDHFFRTLSDTCNGSCIGVILSGTGSDGTLGIKRIKEAGGFVIVQDPKEAEFDGMIRSALTTGIVDKTLPVRQIPELIITVCSTSPPLKVDSEEEMLRKDHARFLQKLFVQLQSKTGRDYSRYKHSTIMRRINRRMQLLNLTNSGDYLDYIRLHPEEARALADDFLITVTNFFRDVKPFEYLAEEIIPGLIRNQNGENTLRVWSVGCATGEEAYSLAILFIEEARKQDKTPDFQIFASDLHLDSLARARKGHFTGAIEADVPAGRLAKFFTREEGGYRVNKEVREKVIFAPHNLLADPPFSRIDLITCRNLMIYLQRRIQKEVIRVFHYSLNADGFLLLGGSESIEDNNYFLMMDKSQGVYQKRNIPSAEPKLPIFPSISVSTSYSVTNELQGYNDSEISYQHVHQKLNNLSAPPSVLLNADNEIVHLSDLMGSYLMHPGGEMTTNIYKLLPADFHLELRTVLEEARKSGKQVNSKPIVQKNGKHRFIVELQAIPSMEKTHQGFVVVQFREVKSADDLLRQIEQYDNNVSQDVNWKLKEELDQTRHQLQGTLEEYETSREEMRASQEEMQSTNEELRSTLEELETSKEELQSMNEELATLNQENRHKVEELTVLSDDLQNLMKATDIAIIFLDKELRIMRFTPPAVALFNMRVSDRGRPLRDITHDLIYDRLLPDVKTVLDKESANMLEIRDNENRWYICRILPYRSTNDRVDGVVITFLDISERKMAEQELSDSKAYSEQVIDSLPEPMLVLDQNLRVVKSNATFYETFQLAPDSVDGKKLKKIANGAWDDDQLEKKLKKLVENSHPFENMAFEAGFKKAGKKSLLLSARVLPGVAHIILSMRDITLQRQAEKALRLSENRYKKLFDSIDAGFCVVEILFENDRPVDYLFIETNPAFEVQTGLHDAEGRTARELVPEIENHWIDTYARIDRNRQPERLKQYAETMEERWFDVYAFPVDAPDQHRVAILFNDISVQKRTEQELRLREEHLRLIVESATSYAIYTLDIGGHIDGWNRGASLLFGYSREEVQGKKPDMLLTGERDNGNMPDLLEEALTKGKVEYKAWFRRKGGNAFWGTGTLMPILKNESESGGYLVILADSTKLKKNTEKLRTDKKVAEETARAKEEFLAQMSHEIRTPLNAIVGISSLLLETDIDEKLSEQLATMYFAANNLRMLVNNILDFSKIRAGKATLEFTDFRLRDLVHSLEKAHEPRCREQGNSLEVHVDEKIPAVLKGDQLKLSQILHNLIGNAVKFTTDGDIRVEVTQIRKQKDQHWIRFRIKDSGPGIPEDKLNEIFDEFTQTTGETERRYEGTGLGLSISRMLLELMDSEISVDSALNKGSAFTFTLRMEKGDEHDVEKDEDLISLNQDHQWEILIVEDLAVNRKLILQFLQLWWGLDADEAVNGEQAVKMVRQKKYDLILMDVRMPIMDGYEASRKIRRLKNGKSTPIIALTADTVDQLRKHKEAKFFNEVVIKPFEPKELQRKIRMEIVKKAGNQKEVKPIRQAAKSEVITLNKLSDMFEQDTERMKEYLQAVADGIPAIRKALQQAKDKSDPGTVADIRHQKVMMIDILGLDSLKDMLNDLQNELNTNAEPDKVNQQLEKLNNLLDHVHNTLQTHIEKMEKNAG